MKLGLIIPANLKYAPYVQYYFQALDKSNVEYKAIVWDKANINENVDFSLKYHCKDTNRKKIFWGHFLFAKKCKKIIKQEKIDHLIVFTIAPVFFLGERYLNKFRGKFILDIRDDSPFRRRFGPKLKRICAQAEEIVVSSQNYTSWTGRTTILCHNADTELIKKYSDLPVKQNRERPVSIVFAGSMIEPDINIEIVSLLKNNCDFSLGFIGKPNAAKERIADYVRANNIQNVWFEGTYKKEEIVDIYQDKASLINIFRARTTINKNALPNKLYDAVVSAIPLVVFKHNEAIARYVIKYNLGIVLEETELNSIGEVILNRLRVFDYVSYKNGRREFLHMVMNDQKCFENMLINFVLSK